MGAAFSFKGLDASEVELNMVSPRPEALAVLADVLRPDIPESSWSASGATASRSN
jgi:hypothetical protein